MKRSLFFTNMSPLFVLFFCCLFALNNVEALNSQWLESKLESKSQLKRIRISEFYIKYKQIYLHYILDQILTREATGCQEGNPLLTCDLQKCIELERNKDKLHKLVRKCNAETDFTKAVITEKIINFTAVRDARIQINEECYGGGDERHQIPIDQLNNGIENCNNIKKKLKT